MRLIKPAYQYYSLVKLKHAGLKSTQLHKINLQYFSLSSCLLSEKKENEDIQSILYGSGKLATISSVSKKNICLSQIEEKDFEIVEQLKKGIAHYPYKSIEDEVKKVVVQETKNNFAKVFKLFTGVQLKNTETKAFDKFTDILIIGGGAVGLSIAFTLRSKFPFGPKVTVVDKNSSFPHASTNLGQSIVTQQQFTDEEEIPILQYGVEFFSAFTRNTEIEGKAEFNLSYDPLGTLTLADVTNAEELLKRHDRMKNYGIPNKILNQKALKEKFPWLNVEDVLFGCLGMLGEGVIDPWAYLIGLKCKALNLGVNFVTAEVVDFGCDFDIKRAICKLPDGTYNSIDFAHCILAGGLETLNLIKVINKLSVMAFELRLPLEERMRYEYCIHSFDGPGLNTPTVVNSDGTYFRRLGLPGNYVAGVPSVANDLDPYLVFESKIKPFLMKRIPGFYEVDLIKGWIDAYDFCISNEVGIIGPHPDTGRIIFTLGFSHLGFLYLPAIARGVMELIYYGNYETIDFTPFHLENLWRKQHLEADRKRRELLESQERVALPN